MPSNLPEVRQDPNTGTTAVRRDTAPEDPTAWALMDPRTGGSYAPTSHVADWPTLTLDD